MLDKLPYEIGVETRMISAENPTGAKGGACRAEVDPESPDNYWSKNAKEKGWKVRPFIRIAPRAAVLLADIAGPAVIKQIFLTSDRERFSELVLRIYWDGEEEPSVECPLGAFFCMGHDCCKHNVYSLPVVVAPHTGCNAYWAMPFRKRARIEIENQSDTATQILAYKILYQLREVPAEAGYFHAQYRRTQTSREFPEHTILDGVRGKGVYVGTYLAWTVLSSGWWGEGEVKFYLDGDEEYPTIADNGTEDYFGGAWNFGGYGVLGDKPEQTFHSPFLGVPLAKTNSSFGPKKIGMYRFHMQDGIGFKENIKVTVQTLGWPQGGKYKYNAEDVASVAFWYQTEPHAKFPVLPDASARREH